MNVTDGEFFERLGRLREAGEFGMIIGIIEAVPDGKRTFRMTVELARAYCDFASSQSPADRDMLLRAASLLDEVGTDGQNDVLWLSVFGAVLFFFEKYDEAAGYLLRAVNGGAGGEQIGGRTVEVMLSVCRGRIDGIKPTEVYTDDELSAVEEHIKENFGSYKSVLREICSPDVRLDICVIPPCEGHDCYTLVTLGMGAHRMDVPDDVVPETFGRAELMISLPPDWDIASCMSGAGGEALYWPIRLLKDVARLPIENETWLGWGHTVSATADNMGTYDKSVGFSGVMLVTPGAYGKEAAACRLPSGDEVNFYQLVPLYPSEIKYKLKNDADALLDLLSDKMLSVVDVSRPAVVDRDGDEVGYGLIVDDARTHIEKIRKNSLPVDELSAYSHMAAYLRFCIEHDLMSDIFLDACPDIEAAVLEQHYGFDLRLFIRDDERCRGVLTLPFFNCDGVDFTKWYYIGEDDSHSYMRDLEAYAEDTFSKRLFGRPPKGGDRYLYLRWGEHYYRAMAKVMEARFSQWLAGTEEPEGDPYISKDELVDMLPNFTGPRGCLATDRIIIDGEPVGVICREIPEPADRGWDSGWRIMTADEYDEYVDGGDDSDIDDKFAVYDLNTVCNYDSHIVDLLDAPYGACYERGDDGSYYRFDED